MGCSAWVDRTFRLHGLSNVVKVIKLGCLAPSVEALRAK